MNPGKKLCNKLKSIRKAVADANGIEYNPTECDHKGRCPGTCTVCDAEIEALNEALDTKRANGEDIIMPEFDVDDLYDSGIDPDFVPEDKDYLTMGQIIPFPIEPIESTILEGKLVDLNDGFIPRYNDDTDKEDEE